jgi:hypothetical protein
VIQCSDYCPMFDDQLTGNQLLVAGEALLRKQQQECCPDQKHRFMSNPPLKHVESFLMAGFPLPKILQLRLFWDQGNVFPQFWYAPFSLNPLAIRKWVLQGMRYYVSERLQTLVSCLFRPSQRVWNALGQSEATTATSLNL